MEGGGSASRADLCSVVSNAGYLSGQDGGIEDDARPCVTLSECGRSALGGGAIGASNRRRGTCLERGKTGARPASGVGYGGLSGGAVVAEECATARAGSVEPLFVRLSGRARYSSAICARVARSKAIQTGAGRIPAHVGRKSLSLI